jgi:hypothetical protein
MNIFCTDRIGGGISTSATRHGSMRGPGAPFECWSAFALEPRSSVGAALNCSQPPSVQSPLPASLHSGAQCSAVFRSVRSVYVLTRFSP